MKDILTTAAVSCIIIAGCNVSGRDRMKFDAPQKPEIVKDDFSRKDYDKYHQTIQAFMQENLLRRSFNGAILVAKNNTVLYENYQGFADLRTKDSITEHTAFHIASTSKTFTAMAVLQLVQEGRLTLTTTLDQFFPGFPYAGVTVKDLLSHRSGLPNYLYFLEKTGWDTQKKISNQEVLQSLINDKPNKDFEPNTRFSYSNTNFVLLALIIEKITGQPYPSYMKTKIFEPLGMKDTYVYTEAEADRSTPSFKNNGRYWDLDFTDNTYGDKNIYSTPSDLLKWSLAVNEEKIIPRQLLDMAYTPYSNERKSIHNYGLGWRMLNLQNGRKVIYHNGRWHGSNSAFAYLPEEKVTIIIVGNKYNSNIYSTARKAYDIFGNYLQTDKNDDEDDDPLVSNSPVRGKTVANSQVPGAAFNYTAGK
ncbi:MAG: serine hydrolase [Terrimonas sp.]|nr:serine hydrolase [Terrimonas sp.]